MKKGGMYAFRAEFSRTFVNLKLIEIRDILRECAITVAAIMQKPRRVVSAMQIQKGVMDID
jgi:hypothetical protein